MVTGLILSLCIAGALPGDGNELEDVVKSRAERSARIRALSCGYTHIQNPSDSFVKEYAKGMNIPEDEVRRKQGVHLRCRLDEIGPNRYRFEKTWIDPTTSHITERRFISHDGKENWSVVTHPIDRLSDSTTAEFGGDYAGQLAKDSIIRRLLGDSALSPPGATLTGWLAGEGVSFLGIERLGNDRCFKFRREHMVNGANSRTTVWLDADRQFTLRQEEVGSYNTKAASWSVFKRTRVERTSMTRAIGPDGLEFLYFYPEVIHVNIYNNRGEETFHDVITVDWIKLNEEPKDISLTPRFEDGSNIRNARTGQMTVYGNGPSPRLKANLERRVEESKELIKEAQALEPPGTVRPPRPWSHYMSWTAGILGVITLIASVCLRRKS